MVDPSTSPFYVCADVTLVVGSLVDGWLNSENELTS